MHLRSGTNDQVLKCANGFFLLIYYSQGSIAIAIAIAIANTYSYSPYETFSPILGMAGTKKLYTQLST
jgi:hypothetical protein